MKMNKLLKKQLWKYLLIFLVFFLGLGIYKVLMNVSMKATYIGIAVSGGIILIAFAFDLASMKDVIPILKR